MTQLDSHAVPLDGNHLIEASAGTGKTYTITNLYLRLLLGRGTERPLLVNEILVLTFTIAATEELRARIRDRITAARRVFAGETADDDFLSGLLEESDDRNADTRLLTAALQLMDEASIFTIHAFCARVLGDNAFETGTLFDQNLDADRDVLLQTAIEDCFRSTILALPQYARSVALSMWSSPEVMLGQLKPFLFRQNLTLLPPEQPVDERLTELVEDIRAAKASWIDDNLAALIEGAGFHKGRRTYTHLPQMTAWCLGDELYTDMWDDWSAASLDKNSTSRTSMPRHTTLDTIDRIAMLQPALIEQLKFNLWHLVTRTVTGNLERYKIQLSQLTLDDLLIRVRESLSAPRAGERLAENLARRWPVAMIDEFQDTDDIQYGIFELIYGRTENQGLFFIGDPKQAIYQFRGADVFTYINARRGVDPAAIHSLSTNWRSNPGIISAINTLFDQPDIFSNDQDIPYTRVSPSTSARQKNMVDAEGPSQPVTLYQAIGQEDRPKKEEVRILCMDFAAEETVRLLEGARAGTVSIDDEPLHAGNIAFLVRDKNDARAARDALARRNVRSVYVTLESVFLTDTAEDLRVILEAVANPGNERAIKAALAVPLMQTSASEIAALSEDLDAQLNVYREFMEYHDLWAEMDIAPMIEKLMFQRCIAQKWFGRHDGERQVTNLRHLAELLQQRSAVAPGMHRLLKWFVREKLNAETVASEERQLRLESDQDLVKIVTMHASKGLEYDVVMIPMGGFTSPRIRPPLLFHEVEGEHFTTCLDFSNDEEHREIAEREVLAEDMRLLYVAITRARARCYIGIPNIDDLPRSALSRLLQLTDHEPDSIEAQLRRELPQDIFDCRSIQAVATTRIEIPNQTDRLQRPGKKPTPADDWHLHSYTGVSRLIRHGERDRQPEATVIPGYADDDEETGAAPGERIDRFTFPRGPRAGVALHTLLENLDFDQPLSGQSRELERCLDRVGITHNREKWHATLSAWIQDVLNTRLPAGCSLKQIDRSHRLDEMEFHFPIDTGTGIIPLLQRHGYLAGAAGFATSQLKGAMTGLIDLIFEFDGSYWLIDYKSNHLGSSAYTPELIREAVQHHHYDLQYLIYCVALTRYLGARLTDFRFDDHFGGVCYLFLRGMDGETGSGIHFDRPPETLIAELDGILRYGH